MLYIKQSHVRPRCGVTATAYVRPNQQKMIQRDRQFELCKEIPRTNSHAHKRVASAHVASAHRHSTRLGELLLGRNDVLFQMLQSLTLANNCNNEICSPQKVSTMKRSLVPPIPDCQTNRRTEHQVWRNLRSTCQSRGRSGCTATTATATNLTTSLP